ncbi:hypothetical protein CAPTEDRAFT_201843 [Capitella teleta]|uniref:Uncharacterized protein n=1 Tax=Capitella teleta TaxID=283909 RepID=R7UIE2_CAPTE|nr:hypothetical protein CAPTEDRAFT_201843 [Capitella teleta]|eukprot:ELU03022.1 hypothetical protein CAPTEDRAFT_201843 [Capitella teleta]
MKRIGPTHTTSELPLSAEIRLRMPFVFFHAMISCFKGVEIFNGNSAFFQSHALSQFNPYGFGDGGAYAFLEHGCQLDFVERLRILSVNPDKHSFEYFHDQMSLVDND